MRRLNVLLPGAFFVASLLLFACKDNVQGPEEAPEFTGSLTVAVFPDIGTLYTAFQFTPAVHLGGDSLADASAYQYRFDWEADGTWDTDWLDSPEASGQHRYDALGKKLVRVLARDAAGAVDTAEARVYVQELVQITRNESGRSQGNADWARDGSNRIVFDWWPEGPGHNLWVVEYPNGMPYQITFHDSLTPSRWKQYASWAPDGEKLVYDNQEGVSILDLKTRGRKQIFVHSNSVHYPKWSQNGQFIAFIGEGDTQLYHFQNDSLEVFLDNEFYFAWSPDNKLLALHKGWPDSILQIMRFPEKSVVKEFHVPFYGPGLAWSPDGIWISMDFSHSGKRNQLQCINFQSGQVIYLKTDPLIFCSYPSWSPIASFIIFDAKADEGSASSLWAIKFPEDVQ